jgi:hypothetical protein
MKSYFASKNEIGIKKGQQVYPRKEAFEMMDEETRRWYSMYSNYEYFSPYYLPKFGWTYVSDNNVPICVDDEKDAFREWLVHGIGSQNIYTRDYILLKYDELNGKAPQEPKPTPKFKVGEKVIYQEIGTFEIATVIYNYSKKAYEYTFKECPYLIIGENEIVPKPKTKLVFSLEKWVEKRMKVNGAKYIVENIGDWKSYDGHTVSFFSVLETLYDTDPDLFVEAEE